MQRDGQDKKLKRLQKRFTAVCLECFPSLLFLIYSGKNDMLSHRHRSFRMDLPVSHLFPYLWNWEKWSSQNGIPVVLVHWWHLSWFLFTFPVKGMLYLLCGTLDHGLASLLLLLCCGPPRGAHSLSPAPVPPTWTPPVHLFIFGYAVYSAQTTSIQHSRYGRPSTNLPRMNSEPVLSVLRVPLQVHSGFWSNWDSLSP